MNSKNKRVCTENWSLVIILKTSEFISHIIGIDFNFRVKMKNIYTEILFASGSRGTELHNFNVL